MPRKAKTKLRRVFCDRRDFWNDSITYTLCASGVTRVYMSDTMYGWYKKQYGHYFWAVPVMRDSITLMEDQVRLIFDKKKPLLITITV